MMTTDLALEFVPEYRKIAKRFHDDPKEFERAFARAWFKLTHRDMGPRARYVGSLVPQEGFCRQDPLPEVDHAPITAADAKRLKAEILESGLTVPELVCTAWGAAATFRATDYRGGVNGARVRLAPQKDWEVNEPEALARVLGVLEGIQEDFNAHQKGKKARRVSLADLIVLAGNAGIEKAARDAGKTIEVLFTPGRVDATEAQTDAASLPVLEPTVDGFRNFHGQDVGMSPSQALVERADYLDLTVPEMTVLVGACGRWGPTRAAASTACSAGGPGS